MPEGSRTCGSCPIDAARAVTRPRGSVGQEALASEAALRSWTAELPVRRRVSRCGVAEANRRGLVRVCSAGTWDRGDAAEHGLRFVANPRSGGVRTCCSCPIDATPGPAGPPPPLKVRPATTDSLGAPTSQPRLGDPTQEQHGPPDRPRAPPDPPAVVAARGQPGPAGPGRRPRSRGAGAHRHRRRSTRPDAAAATAATARRRTTRWPAAAGASTRAAPTRRGRRTTTPPARRRRCSARSRCGRGRPGSAPGPPTPTSARRSTSTSRTCRAATPRCWCRWRSSG